MMTWMKLQKRSLTDREILEYYTVETNKKGKGKMARWTGEGELPIKKYGEGGSPRKMLSEGRILHHQPLATLQKNFAVHQLYQRTFSPIQLQNRFICLNPTITCRSDKSRSIHSIEKGLTDHYSTQLEVINGQEAVQVNNKMGLGLGNKKEAQNCPGKSHNQFGNSSCLGLGHTGLGNQNSAHSITGSASSNASPQPVSPKGRPLLAGLPPSLLGCAKAKAGRTISAHEALNQTTLSQTIKMNRVGPEFLHINTRAHSCPDPVTFKSASPSSTSPKAVSSTGFGLISKQRRFCKGVEPKDRGNFTVGQVISWTDFAPRRKSPGNSVSTQGRCLGGFNFAETKTQELGIHSEGVGRIQDCSKNKASREMANLKVYYRQSQNGALKSCGGDKGVCNRCLNDSGERHKTEDISSSSSQSLSDLSLDFSDLDGELERRADVFTEHIQEESEEAGLEGLRYLLG